MEGKNLHVSGADSEVVVLRGWMLEMNHLPPHRTVGFGGGGGGAEAEGAGWVEGEDSEERIWVHSQVTSAVGDLPIIRWARLTLRSSSGVS